MNELGLREALSDCIDRMAAGQSIGECLRLYSEEAAALRPLLELGIQIEQMQASPYEVSAAQERVGVRILAILQPRPVHRSHGRLAALVAGMLITCAAVFGTAENSLPGDSLYSLKRLTENARSSLFSQQFAARRLEEIHALEALQRLADVEFNGQVERIEDMHWYVAGLEVEVTAEAAGAALVAVGDTIQVTAHTTDRGNLVASEITVIDHPAKPLLSTSTATPSATPTPNPTSTPSPTVPPTSTPISAPTICVPTRPNGWVRYLVQLNDIVSELAVQTGASIEEVLAVNCLPQTRMIIVGQILFLPMLPPSPTIQSASEQPPATETPNQPNSQPPVVSTRLSTATPASQAEQPLTATLDQSYEQPTETEDHLEDDDSGSESHDGTPSHGHRGGDDG